ncbi:hypothetical protein FG386_000896 [Cryptosporidium ryanae]|uniref:uncharacterized protein n=1 Tax=Cryptosporidium ryanae TaxID=515981 RepID=UPI003519DAD1|nr:hypothetical protein FG386_000896 [Cryptosporidium ryanae]
MEVSPRNWLSLVRNENEEIEKFEIHIKSRFEHKNYGFEKIKLKVYRCTNEDILSNLDLNIEPLKWDDYFLFINDYTVWSEIEYIQHNIRKDIYAIQIINREYNSGYLLLKLQVEHSNYYIHDIVRNERTNLVWNDCLLKYNKYALRKMLLEGANKINIIGTPGQVHCFGKKTIGLLSGESDRQCDFSWCSGAYLSGYSFLLCFSHESFILNNQGQNLIGIILKNLRKFMDLKIQDIKMGFLGFNDCDSDRFVENVTISTEMYFCKYSNYVEISFENIVELAFNQNIGIIVINGNSEKQRSENELTLSMEILRECIYSGKIVIIGKCPWGWEYTIGVNSIKDKSLCNILMKEFGLIFTNEYFWNKLDYIEPYIESTVLSNSYYYWSKVMHEIKEYGQNNVNIGKNEMLLLIKDIELFFFNQKISFEMQKTILFIIELLNNELYLEIIPPFNKNKGLTFLHLTITKYRIKEFNSKELLIDGKFFYSFDSLDRWINNNLFWKFSGFMGFNFSCNTQHNLSHLLLSEEIKCPVYEIYNEWQNTGIYLRYKDVIEIHFTPFCDILKIDFNAKILIGCHTDELNLKKVDILNRIPIIYKEYNWNIKKSKYINIESPCDGIVYFKYFSDSNSSEVNLSNNCNISFRNLKIGFLTITSTNINRKLVLSPIYSTTYHEKEDFDNRVVIDEEAKWNIITSTLKKLKKNDFPHWIELQGKKIILTLPTCVVINISESFIRDLLDFLDKVVCTQDELLPNKKWLKERIVCDIQISAGYMHSGYPIVTHLDIVEKDFKGGLLDLRKLKEEGNWGLYHEIGHNRQSSDWTFSGTEEVTVNFFTLYTYFTLHPNIDPFTIEYIKDNINQTVEYLTEIKQYGTCKDKTIKYFDLRWRQNHRVAFMNYLVLIIKFKWDTFKKVFQIYEKISNLGSIKLNKQSYKYKMAAWIFIFSSVVGLSLKGFFKQWGWCFCMERENSGIDIVKLCVEMQNILYKLNYGLCVKREVSETDIISGYDDVCEINGWKNWEFDSLKFISELKYRK